MTNSERRERFAFGPLTQVVDSYLRRAAQRDNQQSSISYGPKWAPDWNKSDSFRWIEYPGNGLRFVGNVQDIRGSGDGNIPYFDRRQVDHNGWFVDPYNEEETVCGQVYQLPARNGENRYVPAISDAWGNPAAVLDFESVTNDLLDAIRWADSMAERFAEAEKEYQVKALAEMRIEDIDREVKSKRDELLAFCRELRANCDKLTGLVEVRKAVRKAAIAMRREIRKLKAERAKLADNPWYPVEAHWGRR